MLFLPIICNIMCQRDETTSVDRSYVYYKDITNKW